MHLKRIITVRVEIPAHTGNQAHMAASDAAYRAVCDEMRQWFGSADLVPPACRITVETSVERES